MVISKMDWTHMYFVILFFRFSNLIVLFFHNSKTEVAWFTLEYSKCPGLLVLDGSAYSKIAKSSPPHIIFNSTSTNKSYGNFYFFIFFYIIFKQLAKINTNTNYSI